MSDPNIRTRRRQWMILASATVGIAGLVGAGVFLFDSAPAAPREKPRTVNLTPPGNIEDRDLWRQTEAARLKNTEASLGDIERNQRRQDEEQRRLAKQLEELKTGKAAPRTGATDANGGKSNDDAARVLDKPLPLSEKLAKVLDAPTAAATGGARAAMLNSPLNGGANAPARTAIEMISFGTGQDGKRGAAATGAAPAPKRDDERDGIDLIPAGSFVRVVMLNGVDAPTGGQAQSNPLPIAFNVEDTANLANRYRLDIRDCRIIAAAWGDLSSERTMGRTESLSCIINGEVAEMPIKGTIMGEDGKVGIRGRLVTKQGQLLANALFAGSLAGIGRAFQAAATTTTTGGGGVTESIDPNRVAQAGIGGGVGQAGTMLAQYYLKAADKLYPVIETDGGRVVEILITKGAVYTAKKGSGEQYRALMRRGGGGQRSDSDD